MFCFSILRKKAKGLKGTDLLNKEVLYSEIWNESIWAAESASSIFSFSSDAIPVNHFPNKQVQHGDFHQASKSHFYLQIQECCFFFFLFITPDKSEKLILPVLGELGQWPPTPDLAGTESVR